MGRLIDASVLQEEYKKRHDGKRLLMIDVAPTVDAVPVVHGRWINGNCDKCGSHAPFWAMATTYYASKFCPDCGALMDGK